MRPISRQESTSVTTKDWVQASKGFFLSTYIIETKEPLVLSGKSVFPPEGSENLSNAAPFSDLVHHDPDSITEAMNAVCEDLDTRPDPALAAAAHRTLARSEW